jgi:hypothetical protein
MPRTPNTDGDIRTLVDQFTTDLTAATRRIALEELLAKLSGVVSAPKRRGPGRPRATAAAAVPKRKKGGKRSAADLGEMGDVLLAHVKANPGARGEQISAALGTTTKTIRLPLQKLIAAKKIKVKGIKRGMQYFVAGRK